MADDEDSYSSTDDEGNSAPTALRENLSVDYRQSSFTFPQKLFHILSSNKYPDHIRWKEDGTHFIVLDKKLFMKEVAVTYFKLKKWSSFQRQLNLYGYKKYLSGNDLDSYSHPFFVRDRQDLLLQMKRIKKKASSSSSKSSQVKVSLQTVDAIDDISQETPPKNISNPSSSSSTTKKNPVPPPSSSERVNTLPPNMTGKLSHPFMKLSSPNSSSHIPQFQMPVMHPQFYPLTFPGQPFPPMYVHYSFPNYYLPPSNYPVYSTEFPPHNHPSTQDAPQANQYPFPPTPTPPPPPQWMLAPPPYSGFPPQGAQQLPAHTPSSVYYHSISHESNDSPSSAVPPPHQDQERPDELWTILSSRDENDNDQEADNE